MKNCPFCGNCGNRDVQILGYRRFGRDLYCAHCNGCKAEGPTAETRSLAEELWNERK